jgi:hypothetical protein
MTEARLRRGWDLRECSQTHGMIQYLKKARTAGALLEVPQHDAERGRPEQVRPSHRRPAKRETAPRLRWTQGILASCLAYENLGVSI